MVQSRLTPSRRYRRAAVQHECAGTPSQRRPAPLRCFGVPWAPELFSFPVQQRVQDKYRREHLRVMPFFDGLLTGEIEALVDSFSGVPEVHHPVRGRIGASPRSGASSPT